MGEPLTEGNVLNLTGAELDQLSTESCPSPSSSASSPTAPTCSAKSENIQLNLGRKLNGERFDYGKGSLAGLYTAYVLGWTSHAAIITNAHSLLAT
ncbi:hypothetical protein FPZ54_16855 [Sphingomonas suaedae]|uniref:Uncharacterized protein n=1 Tax=Sphingomonas suaedae TaxID=2599297 RepID=A0A518RJ76_9SPHN|nr:hypothetical protein [Sphingomonas suaedae]QDX27506.1 hypothetical protein FPZ54_16855 [Sphingomonas suaedae]